MRKEVTPTASVSGTASADLSVFDLEASNSDVAGAIRGAKFKGSEHARHWRLEPNAPCPILEPAACRRLRCPPIEYL
jgi:hypothetical protein